MPDPDNIRLILIIIAGIFLAAMFVRPFYGLISYLIIMITSPGLFYPVLGEFRVELLVAILILVRIALSPDRLQRINFKSNPIIKWTFILYGVMLLSMLQAFDFETSWNWMYDFTRVFLFFIMIVTLIDSEKDIVVFLWIFGILTCALSYDAIHNYTQGVIVKRLGEGGQEYAVASQGMGSGHVALANLTLQGMPVLWFLGFYNRRNMIKILGLLLFLICVYGVVISGSRGGFVGLIALWVAIVSFSKRRIPVAAIGLIAMFTIPMFSPSGYMDAISGIVNFGDHDVSAQSRFTGLINGIDMLIKRPILGVGPGCYPLARKAWFGWGLWAHNHYGELMGDLGIVGTLSWGMFLYLYLKRAFDIKKIANLGPGLLAIANAVIVSTIVRLVIGMTTHSMYIFFWYMMAGIISVTGMMHFKQSDSMSAAVQDGLICDTNEIPNSKEKVIIVEH